MEYYTCRCGITYKLDNQKCPRCKKEPLYIDDNEEVDPNDEYMGENSSWWQQIITFLGLTRKDNKENNQ